MIMNSNSFLKFSLKLTRMCINRQFQTSCVMQKISVGRYKVTKDKSNPLTYEQSVKPEWIGFRKGGHSHNTGQLEGTKIEYFTILRFINFIASCLVVLSN